MLSTLRHDILHVARLSGFWAGIRVFASPGRIWKNPPCAMAEYRHSYLSVGVVIGVPKEEWHKRDPLLTKKNFAESRKVSKNLDDHLPNGPRPMRPDAANRTNGTRLGEGNRAHYEMPDMDALHEAPSTGPQASASLQGECGCHVDGAAENLMAGPAALPCAASGQGRTSVCHTERILRPCLSHQT